MSKLNDGLPEFVSPRDEMKSHKAWDVSQPHVFCVECENQDKYEICNRCHIMFSTPGMFGGIR